MRASSIGRWVCLVLLAAIGCHHDRPRASAVPVALSNTSTAPGCAEAAAGLERATTGLRPPDESLIEPMRERCRDDRWPLAAIECFATMKPDDLGPCAARLPDEARERVFSAVSGVASDAGSVVVMVARLSALKVGVPACDQFVSAVATVMTCEQMPLATRISLGNETAEFWSLPTGGLSVAVEARMTRACGESLQALQREANNVGCMP